MAYSQLSHPTNRLLSYFCNSKICCHSFLPFRDLPFANKQPCLLFPSFPLLSVHSLNFNRALSLTWPGAMQMKVFTVNMTHRIGLEHQHGSVKTLYTFYPGRFDSTPGSGTWRLLTQASIFHTPRSQALSPLPPLSGRQRLGSSYDGCVMFHGWSVFSELLRTINAHWTVYEGFSENKEPFWNS